MSGPAYCASAAEHSDGLGQDTQHLDCYLPPGHASLHYDKLFACWWAAWDESLMVPVQFDEPGNG